MLEEAKAAKHRFGFSFWDQWEGGNRVKLYAPHTSLVFGEHYAGYHQMHVIGIGMLVTYLA